MDLFHNIFINFLVLVAWTFNGLNFPHEFTGVVLSDNSSISTLCIPDHYFSSQLSDSIAFSV